MAYRLVYNSAVGGISHRLYRRAEMNKLTEQDHAKLLTIKGRLNAYYEELARLEDSLEESEQKDALDRALGFLDEADQALTCFT